MAKKTYTPPVIKDDEVFVYIGPTIRGVVQNGSIMRGTIDEIIKQFPPVDKLSQIRKLIIPSSQVTSAKEKIKQGGNSLSHAYKELLK